MSNNTPEFDPAELARLAEAVNTQQPHQLAPSGNFERYALTHRAAIVAALTRAQETEKAIERARAVHQKKVVYESASACRGQGHEHLREDVWVGSSVDEVCTGCVAETTCTVCEVGDWFAEWPCPTIAALGGATTTTGDEA